MIFFKYLFILVVLLLSGVFSSFAATLSQLGVGYGMEIRGNRDLVQYEVFWRQPLPYTTNIDDDNWQVSTAVELAVGLIRESGSDNDETPRFSLMPQVIFSPHEMVNFIIGFGAGYMAGNTEFTDHSLGGAFLIASKIGLQFILGKHWGLEYFFYHQSNAGVYDYNASLNMNQLAFCYNF